MTTQTTGEHATTELSSMPSPILSVPDEFVSALKKGQAITAADFALGCALAQNDKRVTGLGAVALPEEFKVHDLERMLPNRRNQRGQFTTHYVAPFAQYAKAHADTGAMVFVDAAEMRARAVLDLGTIGMPGHADHTASLQLRATAAFDALRQFAGRTHKQQAVAEFFEDWAPHAQLTFFHGDEEIKLGQAIAAVRRITIESLRKLDSEEQQLSANRTAFESVQASSSVPLPTTVYFCTRPYADLNERTFALRLSIHTGDSAPTLTLRIQNMESHTEEMGEELAHLVSAAVDTTMPVLLGTYAKGQ